MFFNFSHLKKKTIGLNCFRQTFKLLQQNRGKQRQSFSPLAHWHFQSMRSNWANSSIPTEMFKKRRVQGWVDFPVVSFIPAQLQKEVEEKKKLSQPTFNFKNVTELNQLPSSENNSSWTVHNSEEWIMLGEVCNGTKKILTRTCNFL